MNSGREKVIVEVEGLSPEEVNAGFRLMGIPESQVKVIPVVGEDLDPRYAEKKELLRFADESGFGEKNARRLWRKCIQAADEGIVASEGKIVREEIQVDNLAALIESGYFQHLQGFGQKLLELAEAFIESRQSKEELGQEEQ